MNAIEELTVRMVSTDLSKEFPLFQRTWKKVSMTESVLAMPEVKYGYLCKFPPGLSTDGLAGNLYKKGWAQDISVMAALLPSPLILFQKGVNG